MESGEIILRTSNLSILDFLSLFSGKIFVFGFIISLAVVCVTLEQKYSNSDEINETQDKIKQLQNKLHMLKKN